MSKDFGSHVRSLRRARNLTQEVLAERSGLSADTIRRLEHGGFSPSLDTLRKLCSGLDIGLATLFESYELREIDDGREISDLLLQQPPAVRRLLLGVLREMVDGIRGMLASQEIHAPIGSGAVAALRPQPKS